MSKLEEAIEEILSVICKEYKVFGTSISKEDILGSSKSQNACRARCVFVCILYEKGFATKSISNMLHRSEQAIGDILCAQYKYRKQWEYRTAEKACREKVCM